MERKTAMARPVDSSTLPSSSPRKGTASVWPSMRMGFLIGSMACATALSSGAAAGFTDDEPMSNSTSSVISRITRPRSLISVSTLSVRPSERTAASTWFLARCRLSSCFTSRACARSMAARASCSCCSRSASALCVCWTSGTGWSGSAAALLLTCAVTFELPKLRTLSPPSTTAPLKLSFSDLASSSNLPLFTTEIENRTMKSAISSVIMSA